jgi:hypothetical protein
VPISSSGGRPSSLKFGVFSKPESSSFQRDCLVQSCGKLINPLVHPHRHGNLIIRGETEVEKLTGKQCSDDRPSDSSRTEIL